MFDRAITTTPNTFELFIRPRNLVAGQSMLVPDQIKGQLDRAGTTLANGAAWVGSGLVRVWYTTTPAAAVDERARRAVVLPFVAGAAAALGPNVAFELVAPPHQNWPWVIGGVAAAAAIGLLWWGSQNRGVAYELRTR